MWRRFNKAPRGGDCGEQWSIFQVDGENFASPFQNEKINYISCLGEIRRSYNFVACAPTFRSGSALTPSSSMNLPEYHCKSLIRRSSCS